MLFLIHLIVWLNFVEKSYLLQCGEESCPPYSVCDQSSNKCECQANSSIPSSSLKAVCGSNGQTYRSKIDLEIIACQSNQSISVIKKGPCYACDDPRCHNFTECSSQSNTCICKPANEIYHPVCGTDEKNYVSSDQLHMTDCYEDTNVTVAYTGFCKGPGICGHNTCHEYSICDPLTNECRCEEVINPTRDPVCGSDGHTYESKYVLEAHSCHKNITLTVLHMGKCTEICQCGEHCCHRYSICNYTSTTCVCPTGNVNDSMVVCGYDNHVYTNAFELEKIACQMNSGNEVAYEGTCRRANDDNGIAWYVITFPIIGAVFFIVLLIIVVIWWRKRRRKSIELNKSTNDDGVNDVPLMKSEC